MKKILAVLGRTLGLVLGLYLIGRAVAEPFIIDFSDSASYRNDWGGPSLAGVLLVHMGPGLIAALLIVSRLVRRRSSARVDAEAASGKSGPGR